MLLQMCKFLGEWMVKKFLTIMDQQKQTWFTYGLHFLGFVNLNN